MSTDHASRLAQHDAEIKELRKGLAGLGDDMRMGFDKLTAAVHELRAQSGPSLKDVLDLGTRVVVIFGAVVGGIIYVSSGGSKDELHKLDMRISRLELVISMASRGRVPVPGAYVPGAAAAE